MANLVMGDILMGGGHAKNYVLWQISDFWSCVFIGAAAGARKTGVRAEGQGQEWHHFILGFQWHHVHHQTPHAHAFCGGKPCVCKCAALLWICRDGVCCKRFMCVSPRQQGAAPLTWWASPTSMPSTLSWTTWNWSVKSTALSLELARIRLSLKVRAVHNNQFIFTSE